MSTKPISSPDAVAINADLQTISNYVKAHPEVKKGIDKASDAAFKAAYDLETRVRADTASGSASANNATDLASALNQDKITGGSTSNMTDKLRALASTLPADGITLPSLSTATGTPGEAVVGTQAVTQAESLIAQEGMLGDGLAALNAAAAKIVGDTSPGKTKSK